MIGELTSNERQRLKELERENRELRRSNDILRQASAYFAQAELDRHWKNNATARTSEWVPTRSGRYAASWILPRRHITGISNVSNRRKNTACARSVMRF